MQIDLDFRSKKPIFQQITEQIRRSITNGEIQPGEKLPTVRELGRELQVNFNTVARAYRLLDESGLISTQRGRGTYFLSGLPAEVLHNLRGKDLEELTQGYLADAARLSYTADEIAEVMVRFLRAWQEGGLPPTHP
jgi:GntR family transcriptional regulator